MTGTAVVVDDSPEIGQQLAGILTRLGLKVEAVCESGPTGLQAITIAKPTLAMIDIQMPGVNGLNIAPLARKASPETKIVMCSGTRQQQVKDLATAAGADAFIVKPYDQILLARELTTILGG